MSKLGYLNKHFWHRTDKGLLWIGSIYNFDHITEI